MTGAYETGAYETGAYETGAYETERQGPQVYVSPARAKWPACLRLGRVAAVGLRVERGNCGTLPGVSHPPSPATRRAFFAEIPH